jgi:hypothetical protein
MKSHLARAGLIFTAVLAVLVIALVIFAVVMVRRPFPQTDGTLTVTRPGR